MLPTLELAMGHATVKVTQRYGGLSDEAVMREALRIGEAGTGTSQPVPTPLPTGCGSSLRVSTMARAT